MKIIIVETVLDGSIIGGGSLYLPGLIKGLVQKGHEVHLVLKGTPNPKIGYSINESGAIIHIKPWKKKGLVTDMARLLADWVWSERGSEFGAQNKKLFTERFREAEHLLRFCLTVQMEGKEAVAEA